MPGAARFCAESLLKSAYALEWGVVMEETKEAAISKSRMDSPLSEALENLAKRFAVSELYVFGSRAREIAGKVQGLPSDPAFAESDVDIGVASSPGRLLSVADKVELAIALEDLLMVDRVDLIVISEADPFLAVEIVRGELLFCEDPDRQAENELYILARAGDLARYRRERIERIFSGVNR